MLPGYKSKAIILLLVSLPFTFLVLGGNPEFGLPAFARGMCNISAFIGLGLAVWGCYFYAKGKGRHGAWAFLGLLAFMGFIILAFFRDLRKQ
jgi:hypothetical protein